MNKIVIKHYRQETKALQFLTVMLVLLSMSLVACLGQTSIDSAPAVTLPPAPIATEAMDVAALGAYPPPGAAYPPPAIEAANDTASAYPAATLEPATVAPTTGPPETSPESPAQDDAVYFPVIGEGPAAETATVTPAPTPLPTATMASYPSPTEAAAISALPMPVNVVDFAAVRQDLARQGRQLAYNKIGFHVTFLEDGDELDPYMQRLDAEGVPFFLKSVDNAEPLYKAQELMKASGVAHTLVYRSTMYDVPDYDLDPVVAAEQYWELEKAIWPPELDPSLIWFETMNELDKGRSEWLAQFALRTAELALRDGYRWAAFSWASGEPEPSDWESPAMLELLQLIGENPDQLAIALHEYSYLAGDIGDEYPHKVGRFLDLFAVADRHDIPRPTVLITEWGWTYDNIPAEPDAMEDIAWAARLYGAFPEVKGAAIWNLGRLDDKLLPLNSEMQGLMDNLLTMSLDSYFSAPIPPAQTPLDASQFPPPAN
ncbi:MAG: hypothetical protein KA586_11510 [Candidatus Promineofilum sp.]|nr:hypothetical protein [Promineifilum sp.]